jgi:hypothetical protein
MTHDPLCPLSWPCSQDEPDHGFCGNSGDFVWCLHCKRDCQCSRIVKVLAQVRQDERDGAVKRVQAIPDAHWVNPNRIAAAGNKAQVIAAIKGDHP